MRSHALFFVCPLASQSHNSYMVLLHVLSRFTCRMCGPDIGIKQCCEHVGQPKRTYT